MIHRDSGDAAGTRRLAMNRGHAVFEQDFNAGLARGGFQRAHQARAGPDFGVGWISGLSGMDHRPVRDVDLHGPRHRNADLVSDAVRRPVDDFHTMGEQKLERGHAVVGKGANNFAIVVAVGRKSVGLDDRPIGQVAEEQIGRVFDPVFLLIKRAATERQVAAAGDGVAADVRLPLDDNDRGACLARDDRRRHAGGAGADHDNIGLAVPMGRRLLWFNHHCDLSSIDAAATIKLTAAPFLCHLQSIGSERNCRMADFVTTHRLTHKASLKMIEGGIAKAEALGCKVSLAVVDQSCRLIAFLMMDGARHFSIITTQRKAITAASQRLPTGYAPEENALSMSVRMGDFTNVPGGFPIEVNGEVIGAVAAGGAKIEQDVEVAKAALAALGL